MIQAISIIGAILILAAYAGNQAGRIGASHLSYALVNAVGSGALALVALLERQWGFLLLESVWSLVSVWSAARILLRSAPVDAGRRRRAPGQRRNAGER